MAANTKKAQADCLGFPLLSIEELQNCLVALGISVANDDIAKPTPQTAQMIYSQLVEILMGAPMSAVEGIKSSLLGMLEHKVSITRNVELRNRICMPRLCTLLCFIETGASLSKYKGQS